MLIVPDIHGRAFWEHIDDYRLLNEKAIFLGDYLDPYTDDEGITAEDAFMNFVYFTEYMNNHPNDIYLLGNHDFGYLYSSMISCRHDYQRSHDIHSLFVEQLKEKRFKIAHEEIINDKKYWFSHAGIIKNWYDREFKDNELYDKLSPVEMFNYLFENDVNYCAHILSQYSNYRGWCDKMFGSCIWSDVREWFYPHIEVELFDDVYQIFAHTRCIKPIIVDDKRIAMVDCQKILRLDNETNELSIVN